MNLGLIIKSYRKANKMLQADLAKMLGISIPTLKKYECNEVVPKKRVIENLTKIIGIDIAYILENELEEKKDNNKFTDSSENYERVQTKYDLDECQKFTELLNIIGIRVHGCKNKITDELKYCMTIDWESTLISAKDFEDMHEDILIIGKRRLENILVKKHIK